MTKLVIPDDLRRFILTSISSVPHLEALLLLRAAPEREWDSQTVGQRLYIAESMAGKLLNDLCAVGALSPSDASKGTTYRYRPSRPGLLGVIDQLAIAYSSNLVGITGLIHSKTDRQAQQFADAFKWRKDV